MSKVVVGFAGRMGSGKSAISNALHQEYGAVKTSFADPLKKMLRVLGLSDQQLWGNLKEVPDHEKLMGKTPRHAMQALGTEWGRRLISPDLWAVTWKRMAEIDQPNFLVIEDVRFGNEVDAIRAMGGIVLGLQRGTPTRWQRLRRWFHRKTGRLHESEDFEGLVSRKNLKVIQNNGTIEALVEAVMKEVRAK